MRIPFIAGAVALSLVAGAASASIVIDATGDFLGSYLGSKDGDLDVTSFSVRYDSSQSSFLLNATFAGDIDASKPGFYAIGVNTGSGVIHPFGSIGQANVLFNQVIALQKTGAATIGAAELAPGSATIMGNSVSLLVPLALLASTGFAPERYGFNIWPRDNSAGLGAITDFSPENATVAAVPEAATWLMMIVGFGLTGIVLRHRNSRGPSAVLA